MADAFLQFLARLATKIFFRRIEIEGLERFPASGPVLAVANHQNALVDAVLLVAALPRMPRFLAKSTLWKIPPLRPFLRMAQVIPVYRKQDEGVDTSKNQETFARCYEELRDGGMIAMFPEGISHHEPDLQPLKTGAARIALEAEERHGPLETKIVPVGLIWQDKGKFRSRVLVEIGQPFEPQAGPGEDPREAVRRVTAEIDAALDTVTVSYSSWREARLLARAAELWSRRSPDDVPSRDLAAITDLRRNLLAQYRLLKEAHPVEVQRVEEAVDDYDRFLAVSGLRDDQVEADYPTSKVVAYVVRTFYHLILRLPLAAVGTVLCILPYLVTDWIAKRFSATPDAVSTLKLFPGIFAYPTFWILQAIAVGYLLDWHWGLTTLLIAPLTGWVALRFHERRWSFMAEARAFLKLGLSRSLSQDARACRRRAESALVSLAELVP